MLLLVFSSLINVPSWYETENTMAQSFYLAHKHFLGKSDRDKRVFSRHSGADSIFSRGHLTELERFSRGHLTQLEREISFSAFYSFLFFLVSETLNIFVFLYLHWHGRVTTIYKGQLPFWSSIILFSSHNFFAFLFPRSALSARVKSIFFFDMSDKRQRFFLLLL